MRFRFSVRSINIKPFYSFFFGLFQTKPLIIPPLDGFSWPYRPSFFASLSFKRHQYAFFFFFLGATASSFTRCPTPRLPTLCNETNISGVIYRKIYIRFRFWRFSQYARMYLEWFVRSISFYIFHRIESPIWKNKFFPLYCADGISRSVDFWRCVDGINRSVGFWCCIGFCVFASQFILIYLFVFLVEHKPGQTHAVVASFFSWRGVPPLKKKKIRFDVLKWNETRQRWVPCRKKLIFVFVFGFFPIWVSLGLPFRWDLSEFRDYLRLDWNGMCCLFVWMEGWKSDERFDHSDWN